MRKVLITFILVSLLTTGFLFAAGQKEAAPNAPTSLIVSSRLTHRLLSRSFFTMRFSPSLRKRITALSSLRFLMIMHF